MKKKVILTLLAILIAVLILGIYATRSFFVSNPHNYQTLGDIPTPMGYTRDVASPGSYTSFLRALPLKKSGSRVKYYTGGDSRLQMLSAAVVDMPILSNYEQCADVTMHLRAEYLYSQGRYVEIKFRNVNGSTSRYSGGHSRKALERYLRNVYGICSTYSVNNETKVRDIKDIQPGDVLVYPARPGHKYGHAILVADVATSKSGKKAILCIEGNTPARSMHVLRNLNPLRNPWHILDPDDDVIRIGVFHFGKDELRHY